MPKPELSPIHWPFQQPDILLALKQREHGLELERLKTSSSIRDVEFQDSDSAGTDYLPSEDSSHGDDEEIDSSSDEAELIDLDVDEREVQDLIRDVEVNGWPSSPTISENERAAENEFSEQIEILDNAEKEIAAMYDPDEVVALLTEFFELLVEIAHWPKGVVHKAPHKTPAVNVDLGKSLEYDEAVLDLMQRLPYVGDGGNRSVRQIVPDSFFYNYTTERDLKKAKKHVGYDKYGATIDSWILPIVGPSNRDGWSIVLDTRLGVIRAYTPMNGPPKQAIEYRRHKELEEGSGPLEYHCAPLVPAAKYLRTLINCYRPLDRIPLMDAYHSDPDFAKEVHRDGLNWYYKKMQDEQSSILALYKECGWPDNWDRAAFVEKWTVLEKVLKQRGKERINQFRRGV